MFIKVAGQFDGKSYQGICPPMLVHLTPLLADQVDIWKFEHNCSIIMPLTHFTCVESYESEKHKQESESWCEKC